MFVVFCRVCVFSSSMCHQSCVIVVFYGVGCRNCLKNTVHSTSSYISWRRGNRRSSGSRVPWSALGRVNSQNHLSCGNLSPSALIRLQFGDDGYFSGVRSASANRCYHHHRRHMLCGPSPPIVRPVFCLFFTSTSASSLLLHLRYVSTLVVLACEAARARAPLCGPQPSLACVCAHFCRNGLSHAVHHSHGGPAYLSGGGGPADRPGVGG